MSNKNVFIGKNVETLFKNSIGDHKDIIEKSVRLSILRVDLLRQLVVAFIMRKLILKWNFLVVEILMLI
jgi:hypothetical protein